MNFSIFRSYRPGRIHDDMRIVNALYRIVRSVAVIRTQYMDTPRGDPQLTRLCNDP